MVSFPFTNGCVDLASVPDTSVVVVMDEGGSVQRLTPNGALEQVLAG